MVFIKYFLLFGLNVSGLKKIFSVLTVVVWVAQITLKFALEIAFFKNL